MAPRRLRILAGLAAVAMWVAGDPPHDALASGDYSCWLPRWTLKRREIDGCNNVPFLSPANDSRVNLLLLLADGGQIGLAAYPAEYVRLSGYGAVPFALDALREWDMTGKGEAQGATSIDAAAGDASAPKTLAALAGEVGLQVEQVAAGPAKSFARGEGNRCRTNTEDAARAFLAQVMASPELPDAERKELARSRLALLGDCTWDQAAVNRITPANVQSSLGREFASYVTGTIAFYNGTYDDARRHFESLRETRQPWLRETAQYMVGRTELNRAQQNAFDLGGYPSDERVDRPALEASEAAFSGYLRDHPTGLYAASAKGLLRRVYWLMNDRRRLGREYGWLLANPETPLRNLSWPNLAREIEVKLLGPDAEDIDDPRLVAVMDLMAMRDGDSKIRARLEAQRPVFGAEPRLYGYLASAFLFYVEGDANGTLKNLPKAVPDASLDYVGFSAETLRGFALEAKGAWPAARAHWRKLLPRATGPLQREQVDLALAMNCERSGRLADVFARDSPVETPGIRKILLEHVAGPALLRRQVATPGVAGEGDTALFALLWKELSRGRYREFVADLALLSKDVDAPARDPNAFPRPFPAAMFAWRGGKTGSGYTCPSLRDVARSLQKNPKGAVGLNCLGEFILRNDLDTVPLDQRPAAEDLGGTASPFPGRVYSRLDGYMQVIADATATRDDRAYALYRAINCFAFSGHNHCGSLEITRSQRRQWFRTLKGRYANTTWGRDLKYYW